MDVAFHMFCVVAKEKNSYHSSLISYIRHCMQANNFPWATYTKSCSFNDLSWDHT